MALYSQPLLWVALAFVAIFSFEFIWLTLVGMCCCSGLQWCLGKVANRGIAIALSLTITNTLAFSRCDKFGQASNLAGSALYSGGIASNLAGGVIGRFFSRG